MREKSYLNNRSTVGVFMYHKKRFILKKLQSSLNTTFLY